MTLQVGDMVEWVCPSKPDCIGKHTQVVRVTGSAYKGNEPIVYLSGIGSPGVGYFSRRVKLVLTTPFDQSVRDYITRELHGQK